MSGIGQIVSCGVGAVAAQGAFEPGDIVVIGPAAAPHAVARVVRTSTGHAELRLARAGYAVCGDDVTLAGRWPRPTTAASAAANELTLDLAASRPEDEQVTAATLTGRTRLHGWTLGVEAAGADVAGRSTDGIEGTHALAVGVMGSAQGPGRLLRPDVGAGVEPWQGYHAGVSVRPTLRAGLTVGTRDGARLAAGVRVGAAASPAGLIVVNAVVPVPERAEVWTEVDIAVHGEPSLYTQELGFAAWVRGTGAAGSVGVSGALGLVQANAASGEPGLTPADHPYVYASGIFLSLGTRVRW